MAAIDTGISQRKSADIEKTSRMLKPPRLQDTVATWPHSSVPNTGYQTALCKSHVHILYYIIRKLIYYPPLRCFIRN